MRASYNGFSEGRRGPLQRSVVLLVLVALLGAFALDGCKKKSESELAAEALQRGLAAHNAGRIEEAEKEYRQVLVFDPSNKWAYYNLGVIDQRRGQLSSAEGNYRKALSSDPNFGIAIYNLAVLVTASSPGEAEALYRQLIALEPENAAAHLNLGFLLVSLGKEEEGRAELRIAAQLDPAAAGRIPPDLATPSSSPSPAASPTKR